MWLNLSAATLRRASGGGTGASSGMCLRALSAAAFALDLIAEEAAGAAASPLVPRAAASAAGAGVSPGPAGGPGGGDASMVALPGKWLPEVVNAALPRFRAEVEGASAGRDPATQTRDVAAGKALAAAVAGRGAEGHRLAVKALFRAGQALREAGALRQAAACLRGGLVLCGLWVRKPAGERSGFDGFASARRLRRELVRVRKTASAIGAL